MLLSLCNQYHSDSLSPPLLPGEKDTPGTEQTEQHHVPVDGDKPKEISTSTRDTSPIVQSAATPTSTTAKDEKKDNILKSVSACDDLVGLVQVCSASGKVITSYRKILLIDSGGQPQFHQILPVFLRRMSLYVFVFKLSDKLDGKPAVEYYDASGKPLGKPYESAHTNQQLLQHCLRTLHTHRSSSKGKSCRIMIVGTHRDMEDECTTEKRKEKERKLLNLLLPTFKKEVVYCKSCSKKFIFPLNAKNPESQDHALVEKIQDLVTTECSPEPVKVPLHYFALEIVLEEASQKLGRGILSIEECLDAAAQLHFDKHTLDLALQYLDELSVVFYFPEVLEGVLFVDPQVLLDKATELVEKMYRLLEDADFDPSVGEWQTFLENARFDLKFLSKPDFGKHYLPGLFTPVELVKLFKKLLIFADFHDNQFFMPALLRVLKEDEVSEYCVPLDSPAAALALDFPLGGPRLGVFCALSCFLVSSNNQFPGPWKIKLDPDDDTPVCLFRNCIRFSIPKIPGSVTLVDTFSHFQVHVQTREERYGDVCSIVRQAVVAGQKSVTTTLGYDNCTPSLAFVCPCKKGIPHVATVDGGNWVCKEDSDESGIADARYLVWEDNACKQKGETIEHSTAR